MASSAMMAILGTAVGRSAGGLSRILADHGRHGSVGLLTRGTAPYSSSSVSQAEPREEMPYDVCIVGAGPAGLAAAIRIKQLRGDDTTVCVLEKGAEVGAHSISGNVFDPRALDELLPDWKEREGVPVRQRVTSDRSYFLRSSGGAWPLPTPPTMKNEGKAFVISLSQLTRWLSEIAEESGVDVFPGFSASEVLYNEEKDEGGLDEVMGVATADMGYAKDGTRKDTFERGIELKARCTLFAEGCRGSLSELVTAKLGLRDKANACPQTYGLGIKEVWRVDDAKHNPGEVWHTVGHPLDTQTYGGGFLYHMEDNMVALGLVVGLDYKNPHLSPYREFQRYKLHPKVRAVLEGGQCLQYGARTLVEGGWQSLPFAGFGGGALVGCAAGTLNAARIKGVHTAMKSGMVAAEVAAAALAEGGDGADPVDMSAYDAALRSSWVGEELYEARNFRPSFSRGLLPGMAYAGLDAFVLRGRTPWTFKHGKEDRYRLGKAESHKRIEYPAPDGEITFDLPTSLYRSGTNHDHDQPAHLKLISEERVYERTLPEYDGPEQRYCPAGVYEYVEAEEGEGSGRRLQINAQNCLHCKACDIKDPTGNICWTVPEGGGGPGYTLM